MANIEMNYKTEAGYEVLYPSTLLANVTDWNTSIYSKSEIDSKVSTINDSIDNAQMNPGGWENLGTFNGWTGTVDGTQRTEIDTGISFEKNYDYWFNVNFVCSASNVGRDHYSVEFMLYTQNSNYNNLYIIHDDSLNQNESINIVNGIFCLRIGSGVLSSHLSSIPGDQYALYAWLISGGITYRNYKGSATYENNREEAYILCNGTIKVITDLGTDVRNTVTQNNLTIYRTKVNNLI